jgi:hypothetical protein
MAKRIVWHSVTSSAENPLPDPPDVASRAAEPPDARATSGRRPKATEQDPDTGQDEHDVHGPSGPSA